jgi:hypothetical protein
MHEIDYLCQHQAGPSEPCEFHFAVRRQQLKGQQFEGFPLLKQARKGEKRREKARKKEKKKNEKKKNEKKKSKRKERRKRRRKEEKKEGKEEE